MKHADNEELTRPLTLRLWLAALLLWLCHPHHRKKNIPSHTLTLPEPIKT